MSTGGQSAFSVRQKSGLALLEKSVNGQVNSGHSPVICSTLADANQQDLYQLATTKQVSKGAACSETLFNFGIKVEMVRIHLR